MHIYTHIYPLPNLSPFIVDRSLRTGQGDLPGRVAPSRRRTTASPDERARVRDQAQIRCGRSPSGRGAPLRRPPAASTDERARASRLGRRSGVVALPSDGERLSGGHLRPHPANARAPRGSGVASRLSLSRVRMNGHRADIAEFGESIKKDVELQHFQMHTFDRAIFYITAFNDSNDNRLIAENVYICKLKSIYLSIHMA